jgi:hypothetical protein
MVGASAIVVIFTILVMVITGKCTLVMVIYHHGLTMGCPHLLLQNPRHRPWTNGWLCWYFYRDFCQALACLQQRWKPQTRMAHTYIRLRLHKITLGHINQFCWVKFLFYIDQPPNDMYTWSNTSVTNTTTEANTIPKASVMGQILSLQTQAKIRIGQVDSKSSKV